MSKIPPDQGLNMYVLITPDVLHAEGTNYEALLHATMYKLEADLRQAFIYGEFIPATDDQPRYVAEQGPKLH